MTSSMWPAGGRSSGRGGTAGGLKNPQRRDTSPHGVRPFHPKLPAASRAADVVFLANIQPDLQRQVRAQCSEARFVALDSMNLWIDTARDSLIETVGAVDCLVLN